METVGAEPDWIGEDLATSRSTMEEGLGTQLDNVFPDDGGDDATRRAGRRRRPIRNGPGVGQRRRRRRL